MSSRPLLSVIMNCYNSDTYLNEAIQSVIAQTYQNWELIFWDNQSTDNSADIVKAYDDHRINYYYANRHTSLGEARNLAANCANGEWIAFLDCDDIWATDKLARQVDIILEERTNTLGIVYGRTLCFWDDGTERELVKSYEGKPLPEGQILKELLLTENFIPLVSALVSKEAYFAVGGIPADYIQAEDYYIFAAISAEYQVRAVQSICCKYRLHSSNITLRQKVAGYDESLRIVQKWSPLITGPGSKRLINNRITEINTYAGLMMMKYDKDYLQGILRIMRKGSLINAVTMCLKSIN